jgi:DNA polymerase III epsilon subunit-like protein
MISIDCEMTGLDLEKCAVISIGAIDLKNPERRIYIEMRPFEGALIQEEGLAINGFTKERLDNLPLSQKEGLTLLKTFLDESEERNVLGQNVSFDLYYLNKAFIREEIDCKIPHRVLDLHSMVCAKLLLNKESIPMEERKSTLNLDHLLIMAGIPEEPKPHVALTGALSAAEVYFRLIEGRSVLPEFAQHPYPPVQSL